jgi:hypothetical protein
MLDISRMDGMTLGGKGLTQQRKTPIPNDPDQTLCDLKMEDDDTDSIYIV